MKRFLAMVGSLALAGCGSATSATGTPGNPAPEPGPTAPGVPAPTGVVYRPITAPDVTRHPPKAELPSSIRRYSDIGACLSIMRGQGLGPRTYAWL